MNLRELLEEKKLGLTIFDIDETLMRTTAKNSSGEKQRMAHWLANMKAGRAKKK